MVDIVRDYLGVHERMVVLLECFRRGDLDFDAVRDLCADDDRSPLFRLKERCHALFRRGGDRRTPVRRAALFDLAVGSLFHEAMKFRENYYQLVVYAPKVRSLRDGVGIDDPEEAELFREFDRIQAASEARMDEALQETEALLAHTADQLWSLLRGEQDGLITRYLIEQRERIDALYPRGLDELLVQMHGDAVAARLVAGTSYLESAHFGHALGLLTEARERADGEVEACAAIDRLRCYAQGMRSFVEGDYATSLGQLESWIEAGPRPGEESFASLAWAATSRVDHLVKDAGLIARSADLAGRIEQWLAVDHAVERASGSATGLARK
jgi:hypothetical protein